MRDRLIELIKQKQEAGWRFAGGGCITDVFNSELADYLIEQGVIVPPCKVGDTVYKICSVFDESTLKSKKVIKTTVIDFVSSASFIIESRGLIMDERDFGKTVFLTREEAEQALRGGEG